MPVLPAPWVAACLCSGRFDPWPIIDAVGGPEAFGRASPRTLCACGMPPVVASRVSEAASIEAPPFLLAGTAAYPKVLQDVPYAPPVLFVHGDVRVLQAPMVAIVGSRRSTSYGRQVAAQIARAVTLAGGVVVSGMAIGIDTAAHEATLDAGRSSPGGTVAVLGQGLGAPLRWESERMRRRIVAGGGAVVSEFLPDLHATRFTFPQRNRVIAGLGRCTVVVEAGHRSGALSTARHALAAGRDVLAVPGPMGEGQSEGCLDLIERGATVVRGPLTVLTAAGLIGPSPQADTPQVAGPTEVLLESLQVGGTAEQLAIQSGLTVAQTLGWLTHLELAGLVHRGSGQRFNLVTSCPGIRDR